METYALPKGDKFPDTQIVGVHHYKDAILRVTGKPRASDQSQNLDAPALLIPEPDNPHDPKAISVRTEANEVVGYLDKQTAHRMHRPVTRFIASGLIPTVRANYWSVKSGTGFRSTMVVRVKVCLPALEDVEPLNRRNVPGAAVLPIGPSVQVLKEDQHFDVLSGYVPASGIGMVLLTLHSATRALRTGEERQYVEVRLDGQRVGELSKTTSAHFAPIISQVSPGGRLVATWGRIKGSTVAAELTITAVKAADLPATWTQHLPPPPILVASKPSYRVPPAYQGEPAKPSRLSELWSAASSPQDVELTAQDRRHSPTMHRIGGVMAIVTTSILGILLAFIPVLGLFLMLFFVVGGVLLNRRFRGVARALEVERSGSGELPIGHSGGAMAGARGAPGPPPGSVPLRAAFACPASEDQPQYTPLQSTLVREPSNRHDKNAIQVFVGGDKVGYMAAENARVYAPVMDHHGQPVNATVWIGDYEGEEGEIDVSALTRLKRSATHL